MNIENWLLFLSIAFIATVTPGPAVLLVSSHSVAYGLRNAVATILGNVSGLFIMSALSVLGLSTIILYSTSVFMVLKYLGAAYLIYLGFKLWRHGFGGAASINTVGEEGPNAPHFSRRYAHGLFVALSNPKAIAFTTALFPQFIDHTQPTLPQFSVLVATFMVLSFTCLMGFGYMAENAKNRAKSIKASTILSKFFGTAFIASGVLLASATQKHAQ